MARCLHSVLAHFCYRHHQIYNVLQSAFKFVMLCTACFPRRDHIHSRPHCLFRGWCHYSLHAGQRAARTFEYGLCLQAAYHQAEGLSQSKILEDRVQRRNKKNPVHKHTPDSPGCHSFIRAQLPCHQIPSLNGIYFPMIKSSYNLQSYFFSTTLKLLTKDESLSQILLWLYCSAEDRTQHHFFFFKR